MKTRKEAEKALSSLISELKRAKHPNSKVSIDHIIFIESKFNDIEKFIKIKVDYLFSCKSILIEIHHLLNQLFYDKGNKEKAENNLTCAFKIDKTNIESIYRLGKFYQENKEIEKSIKFFDKVNQIADLTIKTKNIDKHLQDRKHLETVFNLGIHVLEAGQFLKSEAIFNKVIMLASMILNSPATSLYENFQATQLESDSWFYLGKIKQEQKKTIEAINLFKNAIEIDNNNKAYIALGDIFFKLGKIAESTKFYDSAIKNDPENIAAYNGMFSIFDEKDKPIECFLELIKKTNYSEDCIVCFLFGEAFLRFAKKHNLTRFKDIEQTTVLFEVFYKINEQLNKAESFFSEAFKKKLESTDANLQRKIKEKIQETRGFQKILKNYKKKKIAIYGSKLDNNSIESFELYFKWTDGQSVFATTGPYEDFSQTEKKSSTPHYFLGKTYLREVEKLIDNDKIKEMDSTDIITILDLSLKSLNRAKKLEPEKGVLLKLIQEALSNTQEYQKKLASL